MKKKILFALSLFVFMTALVTGCNAYAKDGPRAPRTIDPVVSTDWLAANNSLLDFLKKNSIRSICLFESVEKESGEGKHFKGNKKISN